MPSLGVRSPWYFGLQRIVALATEELDKDSKLKLEVPYLNIIRLNYCSTCKNRALAHVTN